MIDFKANCAGCGKEIIIQSPSESDLLFQKALDLLEGAQVAVEDTGSAWGTGWVKDFEELSIEINKALTKPQ